MSSDNISPEKKLFAVKNGGVEHLEELAKKYAELSAEIDRLYHKPIKCPSCGNRSLRYCAAQKVFFCADCEHSQS